jgi:hypothetical protein
MAQARALYEATAEDGVTIPPWESLTVVTVRMWVRVAQRARLMMLAGDET